MSFEELLTITGAMLTLMLAVNAFFLRGIYQDLNDVRIQIATIFENSNNKETRLIAVEKEVAALREKFHDVNTELHQLKSLALFSQQDN